MSRTWESLTQEDKNEVVCLAFEWQKSHEEHVTKLLKTNDFDYSYPPSGSDLLHPELWKAAHWRWFVTGGVKPCKCCNNEVEAGREVCDECLDASVTSAAIKSFMAKNF